VAYSLDEIRTLLTVVQEHSISRAAQRLGVAKSVVSQRLRHLENALGVSLLHRSSRGVQPTDRGRAFAEAAMAALDQLDHAVERAGHADRLHGRMRVSAPMSFGTQILGPEVFRFLAQHPDLEIELDYNDRAVDIAREGYDLAIRITRLKGDEPFVARALCASRRVVCASPVYVDQNGEPDSTAALDDHELIGYAHPAPNLWRFEEVPEARPAPRQARITTNNGESMRDAAIAGLGLAVLPLFIVADALRDGRLVRLLPQVTPVPDTVYSIFPPRRHPGANVSRLVAHLQATFAGTPPWERDLP